MRTIYDDYSCFYSYFSRAPEKQIFVEALSKRVHCQKLRKILDIGCYDGKLMQMFLDKSQEKISPKLHITGIDPCANAIKLYMENSFAKKYSVNVHHGTIENYFSTYNQHFDLIIASQCLYWSTDIVSIIKRIETHSRSAVIVMRGKVGIFDIQSRFRKMIKNNNDMLYIDSDIENILHTNKIEFQKEIHSTYIDLQGLQEDSLNLLIAFFLHLNYEDVPRDLLDNARAFINKKLIDGKMRHDVTFFWLGEI